MKTMSLILFLLFSFLGFSQQKFYTVIAKNGLSVREKPTLNAKVLKTLPFRTVVSSFDKTETISQINDGNRVVSGRWLWIYFEADDLEGYVFDGYLLEGAPANYQSWCDKNNQPCPLDLYGHGFRAIIHDYEAEAEPAKNDTIFSFEEVAYDIDGKLLEIQLENSTDSVVILYTLVETLEPFVVNLPKHKTWQQFQAENPSWMGTRPYKRLIGKHNFFRIPNPNYAMMEGWRKRDLGFGDTLVATSGEGGYYEATAQKNGVPYMYLMSDALFKIVLYRAGKIFKTTYIKANFTYGC